MVLYTERERFSHVLLVPLSLSLSVAQELPWKKNESLQKTLLIRGSEEIISEGGIWKAEERGGRRYVGRCCSVCMYDNGVVFEWRRR